VDWICRDLANVVNQVDRRSPWLKTDEYIGANQRAAREFPSGLRQADSRDGDSCSLTKPVLEFGCWKATLYSAWALCVIIVASKTSSTSMATEAMREGKLQCEHILLSGKQCPNRNEPGTMYCGLHQQEDE
jgi:hypothetical protein